MKCPYCNKEAIWCDNSVIYGKRYGKSYMCWYCPCGAYVGCHNNTRKALGTMANKETRNWRIKAHDAVDPLWQSSKYSRSKVYRMLSDMFGMPVHIGSSDIETCKDIIRSADKIKSILLKQTLF